MRQPAQPSRGSGKRITHHTDRKQFLEILLSLDRKLIEVSMSMYSIPRQDRLKMRAESRRVHNALRRIRLDPRDFPIEARR